MHKIGVDPKVKKTLNRNFEHRIKSSQNRVVHDVACSSKLLNTKPSSNEIELSEPTLCSSEALAQYLSNKKTNLNPHKEDYIDKGQICAKMTKKLNFHCNDRIYKNLIELNANVEERKLKKDKQPSSMKKDMEPSIEDFYQDIKEFDSIPNIPVIRPKYKAIKNVESGDLHTLISEFECL